MAGHHQGKAGGHRGAGYTPAGHPAESGSDQHADCGHRFAAAVLCGADGAGIHPPTAEGGHRRSQGQRRQIRTGAQNPAAGILPTSGTVAVRRPICPRRGRTAQRES